MARKKRKAVISHKKCLLVRFSSNFMSVKSLGGNLAFACLSKDHLHKTKLTLTCGKVTWCQFSLR